MTAAELVNELETLGVQIWEEDGQLRFRAPQGVMNDDRRAAVRANRDQVIDHLRRQAEFTAIRPNPADRFEPFPLTDVQSAYLVGRQDLFTYGGVGCQVYAELRMDAVDPARLERAWNDVIANHDMLRATISADGMQQVSPRVPHYAVVTYADGLALRERMAHGTFAPDQWPLFELALTRDGDRTIVHVVIDFLIADYMSVQLLLKELAERYADPDMPVAPTDLSFRDYVLAERGLRDSSRYGRDRRYWMDRLDDLPEAPALPMSPDAANSRARFTRLQNVLDCNEWAAFRSNAARNGVTPTVAVLAAYAAVVGRWSRNNRFLLNLTLLNRQPLHEDVGVLAGDFTTVDILAVETVAGRSFADEAKAVQTRLWEDMDHRLFSGVEVMRELGRRRGQDAAMTPVVFTSTIGLNETAMALGEPVFGLSQTPQVWLDCQTIEREDTLVLQWDIREGVLPDGVAGAMFDTMAQVLHVLADDDGAWSRADIVPLPAQQVAARADANNTDAPHPQGRLHHGFFARAQSHPDAVAVIDADGPTGYGELARIAGGIAAVLRKNGMTRGDHVAISLTAGVHQIAAVLGVHLAGGVYLPLDTAQPVLRRDRILADAGVRLVVAGPEQEWPDGITRIDPAKTTPCEPVPGENDDLAYIIYTSGSTGDPKGVMITHQAALNTVADINRRMEMSETDRVFGLANLNFDLSVYDIFGPLGVGAALVLPDPAQRHDPTHWCDVVAAHGVTLWNSVPAQMQMLMHVLNADTSRDLPRLRRAMMSGDWIAPALPDQIRARLPDLMLYSLGGATEAAIWSIIHPIGTSRDGWTSIPYGKPLDNQTFHVLTPDFHDCPDWVAGELYIGGTGLAVGYLNDPHRTQAHFVRHPHNGKRLYRTGDMGRYRPDGTIEFLGREDSQVKIRGYRIELAEIEAALLQCDGVAAATALVDGDTPMERRLAAFVQPAKTTPDAPVPLDLPDHDPVASRHALDFTNALNHAAVTGFHHALCAASDLPATGVWGDAPTVIARLGVVPSYHRLFERWLHLLTEAGLLRADTHGYIGMAAPDIAQAWQDVEKARAVAGYPDTIQRNLGHALDNAVAMLRGEVAATDVLFPQGDTTFALAAYADTLIGQRLNCAVGAIVRGAMPENGPLRVLEIGAGVGGTSAALIPALADLDVDYQFTDISRFFLNRAEQTFGNYPFVRYGLLDINEDLRAQGYRPNSVDAIVACNVLHYGRDLGATLAGLRELLRPGGQLVIVETTEEVAWTMASLEFLIGDGPQTDTEGLFRSEAEWTGLLERATVLPTPDDPLYAVGQRVFSVRVKADVARIDEETLRGELAARLPAYMIPQRIDVIDAMPVTANGKIDRKTMLKWLALDSTEQTAVATEAMDDLEERIATVWCTVLGLKTVGRHDNFFQIGGDSLLVSQLSSRLHDQFTETKGLQFTQTMRQILRHPTIAELAVFLRKASENDTPPPVDAAPASPITPLGELRDGPDLMLVHEMGGTMAPYLDLINVLKTRTPLFGLAVTKVAIYLERDPATLIDILADEYVELLADAPPSRLAGYGMGGLMAVAVAARLAERGVRVPDVTVIGGCGQTCDIHDDLAVEYAFCGFIGIDPARAGYDVDPTQVQRVLNAAARNGVIPDGTMARIAGVPHHLSAEERLGLIAGALSGNREGIDGLGYAQAHLSLFRHSLAAYANYRPGLFAGDIDVLLPTDTAPALPWLDRDTTAFWREIGMGEVRVTPIDGNHFTCLKTPNVGGVGEYLLDRMRG